MMAVSIDLLDFAYGIKNLSKNNFMLLKRFFLPLYKIYFRNHLKI